MATTTQNNNRAKFLELRANGKSVADARNATYGPAPVVPDATPTPVTPTSQINQDQLAKNQANRQAQIATGEVPAVGQQPAPIVNAPVDPTTGLSAPISPAVQPAPVTPITPVQAEVKAQEPVKKIASAVTPKTEAPIDYTQAKGREQDIINNLNTFKAQNMTPEQIMKASDYQNAAPEKRALIEPYLKQQVPTASAMYNNIVAKADIPDDQKTTLPFKIAQNRYTKASSFSTMTPAQLANEMNNSRFIQGSQTYEDLKAMNPKLVQDTENLRIVNGKKQNVFTYINNPDGTSTKVNNLENTFAEEYMDNFGDVIKKMFTVQTPEEIRAIIYTDDVKQAQDKASEIELTMNELEKQMDNVDDDVDKELAGSGATGSRIALEKASRKDKLGKEYNSQLKNYTTYANKANNLITQNTTVYTTQQQQQQAQNAAMLPFLQDQYNTEQEKIKAEQALNDPATAIQTAIDEYKKLGIPFTSTVQSRLAEFKNSGLSLPDYLTKMRQNIQESPAYQKYQSLQQGQMSDAQKLGASQAFELKKMGIEQDFQMAVAKAKQTTGSKWTKLDDGMYQDEAGNIITADELKNAKLMNNSYISKPVGAEGGECGFYASRGVGMSSTPGGNSKEARFKAFSDTTPQVGGMAFFGGDGYDKTYGHIAIVTGIDPANGTITVKESNYSGTGKVTERAVPANSVTGYYNNTPLAKGVSGETTTRPTSSEANSWVNAWNNGTMDIETILTKIGNSKEALPLKNEVIKAIDAQGGVAWRKDNDPMVAKVQDLIDKIANSKDSKYINTVAGNVQTSLSNFYSQGKSDLLADLRTVIEGGTLQALIDAKAQGATFGALSNEELKMLQGSASAIAANAIRDPDTKEIIGFKMSEDKLKSELEKMKNLFIEKKNRMTGAGIKSQTTGQSNTAPAYIPQEVDKILLEWNNRKK